MLLIEDYEIPFDKEKCLNHDLWYGDETSYVVFRDKIVRGRKIHLCQHCRGLMPKGMIHRARTECFEGQVKTFRFCTSCCVAQAISSDDEGKYLEYRVMLYDPSKLVMG